MNYLFITGGAGFIGSHVVRRFVNLHANKYHIVNIDLLTYAGNLANLTDIATQPNYTFEKADIADLNHIEALFRKYPCQGVIHLAAESHVDRSITDPLAFVKTNILGTATLLSTAKKIWAEQGIKGRFYQVSTDEVYGSLGDSGFFTETTPYDPRSPYSASKAAADHLVRAYGHTYGFDVVLSNCSNNYGPYQFPEKLIPLLINNMVQNKPLPVYGDGLNVRDWLWVEDHAAAIDTIFHKGQTLETYNVGGGNEWSNINLVRLLCQLMDKALQQPAGTNEKLISFVKDRPGHDQRYAIDATKITSQLGWQPKMPFEEGLKQTIKWYLTNKNWLNAITSGKYRHYYETQYGKQLENG